MQICLWARVTAFTSLFCFLCSLDLLLQLTYFLSRPCFSFASCTAISVPPSSAWLARRILKLDDEFSYSFLLFSYSSHSVLPFSYSVWRNLVKASQLLNKSSFLGLSLSVIFYWNTKNWIYTQFGILNNLLN